MVCLLFHTIKLKENLSSVHINIDEFYLGTIVKRSTSLMSTVVDVKSIDKGIKA